VGAGLEQRVASGAGLLAATTGARFNPVLRDLYQRLRQAGKSPKLACFTVARNLLTILNAVARKNSLASLGSLTSITIAC
jgi:transposase